MNAMLLGYCDPSTGAKRRELVLPSALMGCLVCEAMMYCVVAKARSLSDADRNWYGPVSNVVSMFGSPDGFVLNGARLCYGERGRKDSLRAAMSWTLLDATIAIV